MIYNNRIEYMKNDSKNIYIFLKTNEKITKNIWIDFYYFFVLILKLNYEWNKLLLILKESIEIKKRKKVEAK